MKHVYVSFKQYKINIIGDERIEHVIISKQDSDELFSIDTNETHATTTNPFMCNYAIILFGNKMMNSEELLHDVKQCYNDEKSSDSGVINITIDDKYTLCVNSNGDTINYVSMTCGDKGVFKENDCYKRNTNDTFMVRMVNSLYGQPTMTAYELKDSVNSCYEFNKKWDQLWTELSTTSKT